MILNLERKVLTDKFTFGMISIAGIFQVYSMEDAVRPPGVKIQGQTAIPAGEYEVQITFSQRFHKELPLLLNVPNFAGVRIHTGNTEADTEGCILVGMHRNEQQLIGSKIAMDYIFPKIQNALAMGDKVFIQIENPAEKET